MTSGTNARRVATKRPPGWYRCLHRVSLGDRLALGLLVVLPIALYLPSLLSGNLVLPGDDLLQNLPLRMLAGEMLRSGRLPAWDSYIWSGSPLLAGWNAGALFPGTLLFAVLPTGLAWTANLVAAPLLGGVGMHLLLRRFRVGPLGALLGALVFAYTGFMSGQTVHLGLVQGTAMMPFVLLGIEGLANARSSRLECANVVLLGLSLALTVLAGDPRALSSTAIAAGIFAIALGLRRGCPRIHFIATLLAGAGLGALLSAVQWLPGLAFLGRSQRSSAPYTFFGSGSLGAAHIAAQLLVPFLLGGNGNFGLPLYSGPANLPEVTIGCGLVALAAALVYLLPLLEQLRARLAGRATGEDGRHLGALFVLMIVGVVLTLGATTPLGHLLVHLPFFGDERLQNRNAVLFDFPLAVFVGYLVEDLGDATSRVRVLLRGPARLLGALPSLGCVALVAYALWRPLSIQQRLHVPGVVVSLIGGLEPYLFTTIILAVIVGVALPLSGHLSPRLARGLVASVVFAEVALYVTNASYAEAPRSLLSQQTALSTALRSYTGDTGRFAIFNPGFQGTVNPFAIEQLGITDLNIIRQQPSVEGYGSIVNGVYQNSTSTHLSQTLNQSALALSTFDTLDLKTLATLPIYFGEAIAANAPIPLVLSPGVVRAAAGIPGLPPDFGGPWPVSAGHRATFVLAAPQVLRRATIALDPAAKQPSRLLVEAIGVNGKVVSRLATVDGGLAHVDLAGIDADEIQVIDPGARSGVIGAAIAVTAHPDERLLLDGALQGTLVPPHWRYGGTLGPFSIWQNSQTAGLAWLQPQGTTTPDPATRAAGSVKVLTNSFGSPQRIEVDAGGPVTLVRSEGYAGGWTARVQSSRGGPTQVLAVQRFGLVQAINLPKGDWVVTWRYAPTSLLLGLLGTATGLLALLGLLVWFATRRSG